MDWASLLLQIFGVGIQAAATAGAVEAAKEAAEQDRIALRAQADFEETNAALLENSAQEVERVGGLTVAQSRRETKGLKSSQRTAIAANGIDLASQSAASILTSTDVLGREEAREITNSALRQAWGMRTEATLAEKRAELLEAQAESIDPGAAALTSLLGGASRTLNTYYATKG